MVKGKQDFAVRLTDKAVFCHQPLTERAKTIKLAIADDSIVFQTKGLHAVLVQPHNRQTMKAETAAWKLNQAAHIGSAGNCAIKARAKRFLRNGFAQHTENGTHKKHLRFKTANTSCISGRMPSVRGAT